MPITLPDLYQALKDGRAEASEDDLPQIVSFKLNEVQSHLSITNHLVAVGRILINKTAFDKLFPADQQLVKAAIRKASDWATAKTTTNESDLLPKLQAAGMTVSIPDAAAIRIKAKPAVEQLFKTAWPLTTWQEVLAQ